MKLSGHDRAWKYDVKSGEGQAGASMRLQGVDPQPFKVTHYLARDVAQGIDDYAEWAEYARLLKTTVSGQLKSLEIYHPDLAENGIKAVSLKSIGGRIYDGKGGCTIVVEFWEYFPPKAAGGSTKGASANGQGGSNKKNLDRTNIENDPNAKALAELDTLRKQYEAIP